MNSESIVHTKVDRMIEWYLKVLGMTLSNQTQEMGGGRAPWPSAAFTSREATDNRMALFDRPQPAGETPGEGRRQHIAFAYQSLDELLGTYARLKSLGILPVVSADQGVHIVLYYMDPDQNLIELNASNFPDDRMEAESIRNTDSTFAMFDPEKLLAARIAGSSASELHERTLAGEFGAATSPRRA